MKSPLVACLSLWAILAVMASACSPPHRLAGAAQPDDGGIRTADDSAEAQVSAFRRAYEDLATLSGRVTRKEREPSSGIPRISVVSFEADLRKGWIRGVIEESIVPHARGARFVFLNDGKVKVRVKIGFLPIIRTFPVDDDNVTSIRRYRIDQTDFAAMARTLLASGAQIRNQGPADILGRKVDVLRVVPAGLPDARYELIGLDPESHLPVARRAFGPMPPGEGGILLLPYWPGIWRENGEGEQEILSVLLEGETKNPALDPAGWDL